jgi:ABC-type multidrug transport system fused ATPase/permease subunit
MRTFFLDVFKLGKIVEQGKHQELVNEAGLYFELVQQQSLATRAVEEGAGTK